MERTLERLRNREPTTIVVTGASQSVETMWTFGRKTWVQFLSEALWSYYGDGFIWVVNSARCGNSFAQDLAHFDIATRRFQPTLVIMGTMLNDSDQGEEGLEKDTERARQFITRIREECDSEVLFQIPNPLVYGFWLHQPEGSVKGDAFEGPGDGEKRKHLVEATVALADELGCPCVNHYELWKQHQKPVWHMSSHPQNLWMRMADIVHPNSVGHLAIFRELAPFFEVPKYFPWEEVDV